ncbi:MAG: FAD-dependent oxidoreductase, partial [Acidobacteriota bacterium]
GSGVHFCATCDGPFYKGQSVAVIGGGNSAAEESLFLSDMASDVTLLVRGEAMSASQIIRTSVEERPNIDIRYRTRVTGFEGAESKLHTLRLDADGREETLQVPGAFVFIGLDPNTGYLRDAPVRLDDGGFVVTGHALVHDGDRPAGFESRDPSPLETSMPGVFAAGDLRVGSTKQVASAAGEGAAAALGIREYLRHV